MAKRGRTPKVVDNIDKIDEIVSNNEVDEVLSEVDDVLGNEGEFVIKTISDKVKVVEVNTADENIIESSIEEVVVKDPTTYSDSDFVEFYHPNGKLSRARYGHIKNKGYKIKK